MAVKPRGGPADWGFGGWSRGEGGRKAAEEAGGGSVLGVCLGRVLRERDRVL